MRPSAFDRLAEIAERIVPAGHLLVCLGFDGTLAPLVADPQSASLPPETQRVLRSLARREGVSPAVFSGRQRADLEARVGIEGLIYAGNHGLEISGPGFVFVEPTAASSNERLRDLAAELTRQLSPCRGAFVEDKGLTLSVHYRQVPSAEWEEVRRVVHAQLARADHPFHLTMGDQVFEIRPRVYWDKGAAVGWVKEQLGRPDARVVYLGDDATDEDAFTPLSAEVTIQVGGRAETAAHYRLEDPEAVRRFLEWLEGLSPGGGARS